MAVQVCNAAGEPAACADVRYALQNHEFLFGCGAFDALPATDPGEPGRIDFYQSHIAPERAFYQDRVEKWLRVFNYGTLPFYWGGFEPQEGHPQTQSRMRAARFLQARGVRVKGHPLCWHTVCADWLMQYDNRTILQKQLERIQREVSDFRGVVDMWDVINEVVIMPVYRSDNAVSRICRELGRVELVKQVFAAAKQANPQAVLLINDFNLSDKYRELIAACLDAGVPISAIGLQTHQHQGYMGKARLQEILERFSVFGLPLHFTENTLLSGHLMPGEIVDLNDYQVDSWPTTPEGEERQRREWREMYEILLTTRWSRPSPAGTSPTAPGSTRPAACCGPTTPPNPATGSCTALSTRNGPPTGCCTPTKTASPCWKVSAACTACSWAARRAR